MKSGILSKIMMSAGALLTASACFIVIYNRSESEKAGVRSDHMVSEIKASFADPEESRSTDWYQEEYGYNFSEKSDHQYISEEGLKFTGIISIPELEIDLPVCSDFSMSNLKNYPCVYEGCLSDSNMIIAAHNYDSHFGNIRSLDPGDSVIFKTISGQETDYEVFSTDIIPGDKQDEMISGDWDLTLFTCTKSGTDRIAVRCSKL